MKPIILFLFLSILAMSSANDGTTAYNVFGQPLQECSTSPLTGFYRNGYCSTGSSDHGTHVVCASVTKEFLEHSKQAGNDLSTPNEKYRFPGLKPGDKWCLCAIRWRAAAVAGMAPKLILKASEISTLDYVSIETLKKHANNE